MCFTLLFIFGLVFGSFLNVVIFRYSPETGFFNIQKKRGGLSTFHFPLSTLSWLGRSHCMHCRKTLKWQELVPIFSFLFLRGKCSECKAAISWQYPFVEFISGLIFLLPLYFYNPIVNGQWSMVNGVLWTLVLLSFLVIWFIDYKHYIIPDELVLFIALLGLANIFLKTFYHGLFALDNSFLGGYSLIFNFTGIVWINHLLGAVFGALIFGLIVVLSKGRGMGMGDLKLITALGLLMGWPDIIFVIIFSFLTGSLASFYLLAKKEKTMKSHVPFGPFIILGSLLTIFFGHQILDFYFSMINI